MGGSLNQISLFLQTGVWLKSGDLARLRQWRKSKKKESFAYHLARVRVFVTFGKNRDKSNQIHWNCLHRWLQLVQDSQKFSGIWQIRFSQTVEILKSTRRNVVFCSKYQLQDIELSKVQLDNLWRDSNIRCDKSDAQKITFGLSLMFEKGAQENPSIVSRQTRCFLQIQSFNKNTKKMLEHVH